MIKDEIIKYKIYIIITIIINKINENKCVIFSIKLINSSE